MRILQVSLIILVTALCVGGIAFLGTMAFLSMTQESKAEKVEKVAKKAIVKAKEVKSKLNEMIEMRVFDPKKPVNCRSFGYNKELNKWFPVLVTKEGYVRTVPVLSVPNEN